MRPAEADQWKTGTNSYRLRVSTATPYCSIPLIEKRKRKQKRRGNAEERESCITKEAAHYWGRGAGAEHLSGCLRKSWIVLDKCE